MKTSRFPKVLGIFSFVLILSAFLFEVAYGQRASETIQAPDALDIGAVIPLTGPESNLGPQVQAGYEMAADDINQRGGVYVKEFAKKIPLRIVVADHESSAEKAVARMEKLYSVDKVLAYVGTTRIGQGVGVAEKNGVPMLTVAQKQFGYHERGLKYYFSTESKSPQSASSIFDVLDTTPKGQKPTKVALWIDQTDYGIEQASYFEKEASKRGYKVVVSQKYAILSKDMSPLIQAAKAAGAELVMSTPLMPDGLTMIRQMKELDYNPKAFVLVKGADDLPWGKAAGANGDYVILSGGWHHAVRYPGVAELNAKYQAKFGEPARVLTGLAYASIQVIANSIERAGTLDRKRIRDAIAAADMMTVGGPVKFRKDGLVEAPCSAVVQWQNQKQELIWPSEFKTKDLFYPIPPWSKR
jgi:branched-chain amino acid transport system substrate-binding protein